MSSHPLILLHAPSVYDFRKRAILHGPVSDVVPSTQVFEMYPIGFLTILEYLQRHGTPVRIVNIALRMLRSPRFDAERHIRKLKATAFGVDLHWLVHAQGSLELARIVKQCHPQTPVIFGGLSASYFHRELIQYPQVDYVMRGDSTEEPLRQLVAAIEAGRPPEDVPNLTWKDGGTIRTNGVSYSPADLNGISFDYRKIIGSIVRTLDLPGHLPFRDWLSYPIVPALPSRGCVHNCVVCGGSRSAYRNTCERQAPAYRHPELIAQDIALSTKYINGPVMINGDLFQPGDEYAERLLRGLKEARVRNHIALECFAPPSREQLAMVADAVPNFNIQISPESHDEEVRRLFGRPYDNARLEQMIEDALGLGCKRVDLFFMIGLRGQTPQSVRDTARYCDNLLGRLGTRGRGRLRPFLSPLAPFLDPGSLAFEEPDKFGYRLFHRTLEEHRKALLSPSWKYTLNYETQWMSRDELVAVTYESALMLNEAKARHGLLRARTAARIEKWIETERTLMGEIDNVCRTVDEDSQPERIARLMSRFDGLGPSTLCCQHEMKWPSKLWRLNPVRIAIQGALALVR